MLTTMYGSVDDVELFAEVLDENNCPFKIHVDGAYGGFVYPFTAENHRLDFSNPLVSSVTLDAHKMAQAPYGTGIFICRKNLMQCTLTEEASYVKGLDLTLSGSRSGANAIAVWMILMTYGPWGWQEKINCLMQRTSWLTRQLDELGISYYRNPQANIVTIDSARVPDAVVSRFNLVPASHCDANPCYKVVVMEHVTLDKLAAFIDELKAAL